MPAPLLASEVKARADFVAIASRYTRLRRAGRQYVGLCPFHSERHPSLYVHPEKKIFYCFGCAAGGDLFDFIMRAEDCGFTDALRIVAAVGGSRTVASARSALACGVGGEAPSGLRSRPPIHSRKPEAEPRSFSSANTWPSLECAAERQIEAEAGRGSFTCHQPDN